MPSMANIGEKVGFAPRWQAMDGSLLQAPTLSQKISGEGKKHGQGGEAAANSICGRQWIPLEIVVVGANVHDSRLIEQTLKNALAMGGDFWGENERHLCLDRGYDYERVSVEVYVDGFEEHLRRRQEEQTEKQEHPPRRWIVECIFAWLKGFQSIRTRFAATSRISSEWCILRALASFGEKFNK